EGQERATTIAARSCSNYKVACSLAACTGSSRPTGYGLPAGSTCRLLAPVTCPQESTPLAGAATASRSAHMGRGASRLYTYKGERRP
ncbi:unnamed protein product, partial [Musa textilis]